MAINFDHQRDRISSSSQSISVNITGALTIPVGTTAQRPAVLSTGQIRFNSQQQAFEGYNGVGWSTLGGVRDVDGNTYVTAETSPGVNNNELDFYTDGTHRMQISATGNFTLGNTLTEFTIAGATGNTVIAGTLGAGETILSSATISDLTATRVVLAGTAGAIEDSTNLTFDGTKLDVTGSVDVSVEATLASAIVSDLTDNRIVIAGTAGALEDDANLTYDGTDLTTNSLVVGDLTDNRIVIAGANGAIEDDTNFRFNGTIFQVGTAFDVTVATGALEAGETTLSSATISDLTATRVVLAGTAGAIEDSANLTFDGSLLTVTGDFEVTGNVNIGGNITIGDANTDAITVAADFESHLVPDISTLYDLGSNTKSWRTLYVDTVLSNTTTLTLNNDIVDIDSTGALIVPVGTTINRPSAVQGMLRYNTTDSTFEGYDGTAWAGLGGVIDIDQNTYIIAETSPGANNNELDFWTNGSHRMQIGATGDLLFGDNLTEFTIAGATGNVYTAGDLGVTGETTLASAIVSDLTAGRVVLAGTSGAIEDSTNLTFNGTTLAVTGAATISTTLGVTGETTLASAIVSDLTDNRIVLAGTAGALEDDANFTFDGTELAVGVTNFTVQHATGNTDIAGTLDVTGAVNVNNTTTSTSNVTGALIIDGGVGIAENLNVGGNVQITGSLTVDGIATLKAGTSGTINLGDSNTDNLVFGADINSSVIPNTNITYDLGAATQNWRAAYVQTLYSDTDILTINSNGAIVLPIGTVANRPAVPTQGMMRYNSDDTTFEGYDGIAWGSLGGVKDVDQDTYITAEDTPGTDNDELDFYTAGNNRMTIGSTGQITAAAAYVPIADQDLLTKTYAENSLVVTAGSPTDGTWQDGAYLGFTNTDKVVDILDELNESLENVRNNTFVRAVTFSGSPTIGGAGTTVTLTLTVDGNANRYDIDWGDSIVTTGTADSTPSHTYTSNAGSPYTVAVRAYNNSSISGSAGSEASASRTDYIIIYTADSTAQFALYNNLAGGTSLIGNNLYVIEGNSLYLENNTSNTLAADVTYGVDWGDGSTDDTIASDAAAGGVSGTRLQHTWPIGSSSGTALDTVTLTLTSHSTADPATIPTDVDLGLKVYDPNIAAPDGLNTKIMYFANPEGNQPRLAAGADDNTVGTTLIAGQEINYTNNTTGQLETTIISTYAYDAAAGTLSAVVNNNANGTVTFDGTNNAGTYTSLVVTEEEDYNLLNATGSATSFNSSIYHPGLYTGFKAKVSASAAGIPMGINSFQLSHSTTGDTPVIEFVKDDITTIPTVVLGALAENVGGTKRYISGIPYYNTGSPSIVVSGTTISSWVGQAYSSLDVVTITSASNVEGTTSNSINFNQYSFAQVDAVVSFLTNGIPNKNTGNGVAVTIGDLVVPITTSSVRTIDHIGINAYNVIGNAWHTPAVTALQVHTAAQSGISEIAIAVSDSLGATYNDDAVRVFDFSAATTNTPAIPAATNFYTNSVYTEAADPGVEGTQEATIRLGKIVNNVVDYSTGFLPVGPNRSGDTGIQYITIAFRRSVVANFNINITSTGVSGVWIAAPGTTIDNTSTINGWLECGTQYGGAGVPGANTGSGGNGSNGCAVTGGDIIATNTALSGSYLMTLGTENLTNATNNVALVRIALNTNQSITALSIT
tara:strand:- start:1540 stop:6504 length:4965 start_codon:yes stop_codon:yes gene_type:complete